MKLLIPQQRNGEQIPMVAVMNYFGMKVAQFRVEWLALSDEDKEQLKAGIESGSLTY